MSSSRFKSSRALYFSPPFLHALCGGSCAPGRLHAGQCLQHGGAARCPSARRLASTTPPQHSRRRPPQAEVLLDAVVDCLDQDLIRRPPAAVRHKPKSSSTPWSTAWTRTSSAALPPSATSQGLKNNTVDRAALPPSTTSQGPPRRRGRRAAPGLHHPPRTASSSSSTFC